MRKTQKRINPQKRRGGGKGRNSRFTNGQLIARASGFEDYATVQQVGTLNGLMAPDTGVTGIATAGQTAVIGGLAIGPRAGQICDLYNQFRVNKLRIIYRPATFQGGAFVDGESVPVGEYPPRAQASFLQSRMAGGFVMDPLTGPLSYREVIESGGRDFNPARPFSWNMPITKKWYYSQLFTTELSEIRQTYAAQFNLVSFDNAPTEAQVTFGQLVLEWDLSFRFPADSTTVFKRAPISFFQTMLENQRISAEAKFKEREQKTDEDSPIILPRFHSNQPVLRPVVSTPRPKLSITIPSKKPKE